ncbi:anti-sigma factor family protein [Desulfosoma caldarium]|uniref:Uncharacterized protein n=1 Tax=Desulfosoma caldarium TaxID=610254 RepID=A0A3N1V0V8_9BACT|nr:hypothetical protein [Desulfosoma caldarium]ROQ93176.1 hypothetical protein EDC27_1181 [Desulfosoma caldarium]
MNGCKDFEEMLILDLFDELPTGRRSRWSVHVAQCDICMAERRRLERVLQQVKAAGKPEPMAESDAARMKARVRWALNNAGRASPSTKALSLWRRFGLRPAWALGLVLSAAVMVAGLSWKGLPRKTAEMNTAPAPTAVATQDQEVVENLEFLKDLETIRKLVTVVDQPDQDPASTEAPNTAPAPVSSHLGKETYA